MKSFFRLGILVLSLAALVSCGDDEENPIDPSKLDPPNGVTLENLGKVTTANGSIGFSVKVTWAASSDESSSGFKGYNVYRNEEPLPSDTTKTYLDGFKANASEIPKGTLTFTDTLLVSNTNYYYHVRSVNDDGISVASDNGTQPVATYHLMPPTNIQVSNTTDGNGKTLKVTWTASADADFTDCNKYQVWRLERTSYVAGSITVDSIAAGTMVSELSKTSTEFTDDALTISAGKVYYYTVVSTNTSNDLGHLEGFEFNAIVTFGSNEIVFEAANPNTNSPSAFSFALGKAISLQAANKDSIDFYLGTENDTANDTVLKLKSPNLAASGNYADRVSGFQVLGADWNAVSTPVSGFSDSQDCSNNSVYSIKFTNKATGAGETHYVKFQITDLTSTATGTAGTITFKYNLQSVPGLPRF